MLFKQTLFSNTQKKFVICIDNYLRITITWCNVQ